MGPYSKRVVTRTTLNSQILRLAIPSILANITIPLVPGVFVTTVGFLCIGYIIVDITIRLLLEKMN